MAKKRVLFLAHSALCGGAEFCLDTTLRFLNRDEIEPFVIFPTDGPMAESARNMGATVEIVPFSWWMLYEPSWWERKNRLRIPFRVRFLKKFIQKHEISAVYTNTVCLFEGVLAARAMGIPHITHVHEVLEDRFMRPRWFSLSKIVRFYYENSVRVVFESDSSRKVAEKILCDAKIPKLEAFLQKSAAVSNSSRITLAEAENYTRENAKSVWKSWRIYGVDSEKWTILWLGRFSERKNPEMLLRAVEKLPNSVREAIQVLFVGDGPLEKTLHAQITTRKLENSCRILPFQKDIRPLLRLAKTLVLTSYEESFGLVLVEAGMFALPILAVRSQGPSEIILDGENGFLTDAEDAQTLANRLETLFSNPILSAEMGRRNRQRVLELYNPIRNTEKLVSLFE